jgi:hypothetical protein
MRRDVRAQQPVNPPKDGVILWNVSCFLNVDLDLRLRDQAGFWDGWRAGVFRLRVPLVKSLEECAPRGLLLASIDALVEGICCPLTVVERSESCTARYSSQLKHNYFTVTRGSTEESSCARLVDFCITQL